MKPLSEKFFRDSSPQVAQNLLGQYLVYESPQGRCVGRISEVEAYLGADDAASHSAPGPTARNAPVFKAGGVAYVYFVYGMHECFNVVAGPEGRGDAVLIRAVEPVEGLDLMFERRGVSQVAQLCSGPAKLCQAFGLSRKMNGWPLTQPPLYIARGRKPREVLTGPRIGISKAKDLPLRFVARFC